MKLPRLFGRDDERSRKGAEIELLEAESTATIQRRERATKERDKVVSAVRNTVRAIETGRLGRW